MHCAYGKFGKIVKRGGMSIVAILIGAFPFRGIAASFIFGDLFAGLVPVVESLLFFGLVLIKRGLVVFPVESAGT